MSTTGTEQPTVQVFPDREALGRKAGDDIAAELRRRLAQQDGVRMIFAAAPSQQETLARLRVAEGIDWSRVTAFHMDEYVGLPADAPQRFAAWLNKALFDHVPFGKVHLLDPTEDLAADVRQYADELASAPIDLVVLGIGVNGHIAFNDPPDADLDDPEPVRVVELAEASRRQQVDDECFDRIEDVPTTAITLTVPRLLDAERLFCVVPGALKANAVRAALTDPIGPACPATVLRRHADCTLYLDKESAAHVR
ncbi:glucosamine-6-phosphate deaminase [Kribbella amoyensis]|uniref:Glucosamine-6-phosphate deaminase n=1 Tax=Kribbella amoyensis TaxID=996641 RepID=A0A561BN07_9ACTN|nr:glucosamine-6-phosphate deaminase [Kribbella amoyensis]TWD80224.1 glucosamine-6-phosphate deaminase [Kribbella amoyensis]